ncbi:periplasmic binding protein [Vulcanisaeta moutnovskia 768-28]|uniref:Periplasmic binding protein n=1 Tax=Vulcanisaeta moutnovskia (strain 768-28) TaxID=985053 RepID=F0QX11_VULM7|nr:ABC transporter substrate-binding protein [Vulcanisaeta moutnovskia]ADY01129.1 periplasmic binding protein [Vulcanisaeta moutnovskia 768-28]
MSRGISKALIIGVAIIIAVVIIAVYYATQVHTLRQGMSSIGVNYPITVIDYLGRNITIYSQPSSVGTISPDCTQIIYVLGFGSRVILIDAYSEQLLNYLNVTIPSNATTINSIYGSPPIEPIITAHPSLLCADAGFQPQLVQSISTLSAANINVIFIGGTSNTNVTGIENDIMLMAKALGVPGRGEEVISHMNNVINYVESKVSNEPRVTVAYISWYNPIYVAGNSSFVGYYINLAGGYDPFNGMYPTVSPSQLLAVNPDYIIVDDFMGNYTATLQAILSIPGINSTNAVKEDHIYILGNFAESLIEEPGPLSVYGALLLAMILHPSAFSLNSTAIPHYISAQWVDQYVKPNLNITLSDG